MPTDTDISDGDQQETDTEAWIDPPQVEIVFEESDEILINPERGFYMPVDILSEDTLDWVREQGFSLVYSYVMLDDFRERPLTESFLDDIDASFDSLRDSGLKIILRFAYNLGPWPDSEPDASKAQILEHIEQLTPILRTNADVLSVVQAGFIGAWGEWHSSTNGLLDHPQDKFDILEALLDALPEHRMVQLRYPPYKEEGYGGPLRLARAHNGTYASRIGHHNDCFLSSDTDVGTYPDGEIEYWLDFLQVETQYLPMGGETCSPNSPRSDCPSATSEMERLHFTYINDQYHPGIVRSWVEGGCYDQMSRLLGYRFVLRRLRYPESVPPGGVLTFELDLDNLGWAAPFNARPVVIVFEGPEDHQAELELADPRYWFAADSQTVSARIQLPSDITEGKYVFGFWLPDESEELRNRSEYSIRCANAGNLWNEKRGIHFLTTIEISESATGSRDSTASEFRVIEEY